MLTKGSLFIRSLIIALLILFAFGFAPQSSITQAQSGEITSDDFNHCPLSPQWTFENPANISGASPVITGQFTGEALLQMAVPSGQSYTFSNQNRNAPRLMQAVSDNDFEVEVKFLAPFNTDTSAWKIEGILVRDATNPSQPRWFRFDFNTRNGALNSYLGYLNAAGALTHIQNVLDMPGSNPTSGPLFIRVRYQKATGTWTVPHQVGSSGSITRTVNFQESTYDPNFVVTHVGIFVASTSSTTNANDAPGNLMVVDHWRNTGQTSFVDDNITLTVNRTGGGQGTVNWPMTNPNQCNNNTVTLTATPVGGSTFGGWSGDAAGSSPTVQVQMNTSKNVTAIFNSGTPVEQNFNLFIPLVER